MVAVIVAYARRQANAERVEQLFRYPDPITFITGGFVPSPSQGLFLVDVVYEPEMFTNPIPYARHSWDNLEKEEDEETEEDCL